MKESERAELARQVVENPVYRMAVEEMREAFIRAWIATNEGDTATRDLAWRHVKFLDIFTATLQGYIDQSYSSPKRPIE